ncbi:MAG: sn-glycerol-1-phosphate dehydrogenase [Verrucomicrobiota bacterium]
MQNDLRSHVDRALAATGETRCLALDCGVLGTTPEVFGREFGDKPALLVADRNTFAAAGRAVREAFAGAGRALAEPFIYSDPQLYAEHRFVVALEEVLRARPQAIPVAVGSGTINDLTKLAAHRAGRRYLAVATAASMDGYTAFGASITYQGSKQTFPCPAPSAVVADLEVIRAAPAELNAAGYADLMAKTVAGADWLLADAVGTEPINEGAWEIVQGRLREVLAKPAGVRTGDLDALRRLTQGLMLGGLAMVWARSSRAASGAEHLFSHLWDMQHHTHAGKTPWHGFKVGIGTLAVTALYEYLLSLPLAELDLDRCCAQWPDEAAREKQVLDLFEEGEARNVALAESRAKAIDRAALRRQLERLRGLWPRLSERLREQLLPFAKLRAMLQAAGAPVEPEQIGISRPRLRQTFWQACLLRRRFTVLDLAARTGTLERGLERLFGPGGRWNVEAMEPRPVGIEAVKR